MEGLGRRLIFPRIGSRATIRRPGPGREGLRSGPGSGNEPFGREATRVIVMTGGRYQGAALAALVLAGVGSAHAQTVDRSTTITGPRGNSVTRNIQTSCRGPGFVDRNVQITRPGGATFDRNTLIRRGLAPGPKFSPGGVASGQGSLRTMLSSAADRDGARRSASAAACSAWVCWRAARLPRLRLLRFLRPPTCHRRSSRGLRRGARLPAPKAATCRRRCNTRSVRRLERIPSPTRSAA